jgi:hypothetical protein
MPVEIQFLEDPTRRPVFAARKWGCSQAARRHELLLLLSWVAGTMLA